MKLYFRALAALLRALFPRPRVGILEESVVSFRVWPTDLDFNLHLNNARYLSFMDIGRFDGLSRLGILRAFVRNRWHPVVGAIMMRFRRSLDPWRKFQLVTRIVGWDDKWFYIEQRFERRGEVYAYALVRAVIRDKSGTVAPAEALSRFGFHAESPRLPAAFVEWRDALDVLADEQRRAVVRKLA